MWHRDPSDEVADFLPEQHCNLRDLLLLSLGINYSGLILAAVIGVSACDLECATKNDGLFILRIRVFIFGHNIQYSVKQH